AALIQFEYDNYVADSHHAPLLPRSNISGFDVNYHAGLTRRGNLTSVTSFRNAQNQTGPVSSYFQYDIAGNVVKSIDARNYATTFDFSDRFGAPDAEAQSNTPPAELASVGQSSYAFATKITNALGHSSYTQFDYYLSRPVDKQDINGVVESAYFADPADRITKTIRSANDPQLKSQTTFAYDDANRVITSTSDLRFFADPSPMMLQVVLDSFGRQSETRQFETPTTYIAVQTRYDALGRAHQTSNPFRPLAPHNESAVWTTTAFDAMGRPVSVTTPDNAVLATAYNGERILVNDPSGKKRISKSDALGRLRDVWEITPADSATEAVSFPGFADVVAGYRTSYSYDTIDNLVTVNQGSQTRTFVYDSLSRPLSATNPESGTVCYGTVVGGQCQANGYDGNGNLTIKTDARNVVTNYMYDALNRITTRDYSDSTPDVSYVYDSTSISNGIGRLASVSSTVSTSSRGGYDSLGQPLSTTQTIGAQNYTFNYTYDLAGNLKTITYPSGRAVSYNYDMAGRLADLDAQNLAFTGNLGDGTQRTYSSAISYSAFSGITIEKFGMQTPLYHKRQYNVRGQLWDVRVATAPDVNGTWNRGCLQFFYDNSGGYGTSGPENNGNVLKSWHYVPLDEQSSNWAIHRDSYNYDPSNRISSVSENYISSVQAETPKFAQTYSYDRYGNRTVSAGVNNLPFDKSEAHTTNRIYAPGDTALPMNQRQMRFDAAGNLTYDTYTGQGTRVYDGENRMIEAAGTGQPQYYSYDGDGRRIKRKVNQVETWQVYGVGGELLAEYALNGSPANPQKEYGYRNGELLITAAVTSGWGAPPTIADNPLNPPGEPKTDIKAIHITQLRAAINALRSHLNMGDYQWQKPTISGGAINSAVGISWEPIDEMRTALNEALGPPANGYTAGLAVNQPILAAHIQELRDRVLASWQSGGGGVEIRWLVADQIGTPRIIIDQTGSLAGVSRHDYLPFGEEVPENFRTGVPGYSGNDAVRQKFTGYERDLETGLDFAQARYYASLQGRFTSPDPENAGVNANVPQSWNGYSYTGNNPIISTDPSGLVWLWDTIGALYLWVPDEEYVAGNKYFDDKSFVPVPESMTGSGGITFVLTNGSYTQKYPDLVGREVYLGRDGKLHETCPPCQQLATEMNRINGNGNFEKGVLLFAGTSVALGTGIGVAGYFTGALAGGGLTTGGITTLSLEAAPAAAPIVTTVVTQSVRTGLLNGARSPAVRKWIEYLYRQGAKIGDGSTADAIRFERLTGQLLSKAGHSQKGKEAIAGLERLLRTNKLGPEDTKIVKELISNLKDALK
ncbi:MAG: RHS repeat-associated core domain-containing protein, partial [Pyrinomonadaceae bacterium]